MTSDKFCNVLLLRLRVAIKIKKILLLLSLLIEAFSVMKERTAILA